MSNSVTKLCVLISGNGSNLQAIIDEIKAGRLNAEISGVISNRPTAYGLERAKEAGINAVCLDHTGFDSRESYDGALKAQIEAFGADCVVLAGFMRILTPEFVDSFAGKLVNIHPSLLPKYKGLNTHQRAIDNGETRSTVLACTLLHLSSTAALLSFKAAYLCLKTTQQATWPSVFKNKNVVSIRLYYLGLVQADYRCETIRQF